MEDEQPDDILEVPPTLAKAVKTASKGKKRAPMDNEIEACKNYPFIILS